MSASDLVRDLEYQRQRQADSWRQARAQFHDYQVSDPEQRVRALGRLFELLAPWLERGIRSTALRHFLLLPTEMLLGRLFAEVVHREDLPAQAATFLMWIEGTILREVADPASDLGVSNGAPGEPPAALQERFHQLPFAERAVLYLTMIEGTASPRLAARRRAHRHASGSTRAPDRRDLAGTGRSRGRQGAGMNRAHAPQPGLSVGLVRALGQQATGRLGELFLANAIQAGLRLSDGVKYRPVGLQELPVLRSTLRLRVSLRRELRDFLAFLEQHPAGSTLPLQDWRSLSAAPELWTDPLLSAAWAASLLPDRFDARLTQAVNLLRRGDARPALAQFQANLVQVPRAREPRAQLLRNAAASYEVLGDDAGARWCAEQSYAACPWSEASLASHLIYLALDERVGDRIQDVAGACRAFRGKLDRASLWEMLDGKAGRASQSLHLDPRVRARFREAVLS